MFLDATENWKDGSELTSPGTAFGAEPIIAIVGGISKNESYGMGTWASYM